MKNIRSSFMHYLLGLLALLTPMASAADQAKTLTIGLPTKPNNTNVLKHSGTWNYVLLRDINDTLVRFNMAVGEAQPAHAYKWSYDPEHKTYTFHLRKDLRWSDGEPINAYDYVRSWRIHALPFYKSTCASFLRYIKNGQDVVAGRTSPESLGITALDQQTVELRLSSNPNYFFALFGASNCFPIPFHKVSEPDLNKVWHLASVPSSGPYMLEKDIDDSPNVYLKKNPLHWNKEQTYFDKIVFQSYAEKENLVTRDLLAGKIQIALHAAENTNTAWLLKHHPQWVKKAPIGDLEYLSFDPKNPGNILASSKLIRQAMSMAINRTSLASESYSAQAISEAFTVTPVSYYRGEAPIPIWSKWSMERRVSVAKKIMKDLGYTKDSPLRITYHVNEGRERPRMATSIANMWRGIGIEAKLILNPTNKHYESIDTENFHVARQGWNDQTGFPAYFLKILTPDPPFGLSSLTSDQSIAALDALEDEGNVKKIEARQLALERVIQEETLIIPVIHQKNMAFVHPRIEGYNGELWGFRDLYNIHIKEGTSAPQASASP